MAIPDASWSYTEKYGFSFTDSVIKHNANTVFRTHSSDHAERLHRASQLIFVPIRQCMTLLAHLIEPLPGSNKDSPLTALTIRVSCLAILWLMDTDALISFFTIAMTLRLVDHLSRPVASILYNPVKLDKSKKDLVLTQENPLHVRTHNVGLVPSWFSVATDLRDPIIRAEEIVFSILTDPDPADIIFFQETFNEDATRVLCEGIKVAYPYIIHNVAPEQSGLNSGAMVASKYPFKEIEFERLEHMIWGENMSPRGIIKVRIEGKDNDILLYGVHAQPLVGRDRSHIRYKQLKQIKHFMKKDAEKDPHIFQIVMGDFNTSRVTEWGEDNIDQPEKIVVDRFDKYFHDFFLEDHDKITGKRNCDIKAIYLKKDNIRLNQKDLPEPTGSWYHGPMANKGIILELKSKIEQVVYGFPDAKPAIGVNNGISKWGTEEWVKTQEITAARLDYIVAPKNQKQLEGRVEIRRIIVPMDAESASSDHLPVDGKFWKR